MGGFVRKGIAVGWLLLLATAARAGDVGSIEEMAPADFRQIVRAAKQRVFPAVVYIKCIREGYEQGKRQSQEVSGSGVIISPRGEALTNWHVVEKALEVRCLLLDGQALAARVLGTDKDTDLALLQLELPPAAPDLPHAQVNPRDHVEEGDFVMAMGAPWGLSRSVSIGIISCTRRYLPEASEYSLWLQSDCAISPGNSGGPLVNTAGDVIGLTARGQLWGGDMAFAVPADTIEFIVQQIRAHGSVKWSWTGLLLQPLRDFDRNMYFDAAEGVIVAGTESGSPAHTAGFEPRDRIVKINDVPITGLTQEDVPALRALLGRLPVGQAVQVLVDRGGTSLTLPLTPREKGAVEGTEYDCRRWDFTVKTINQFDNPTLSFHRAEGVFIFSVKEPGNAERAGLRPQDIVTAVDGREIRTLDDVRQVHTTSLAELAQRHRTVLTILRNGLLRQVVLDYSRDFERE